MYTLIQILFILNFSSAMAQENSIGNLEKGQSKLREQIQKMITGSTCQSKNDCSILLMGNSGGCGNPDTFLAYNPKKVKTEAIDKLVKMERELAAKIQKEKSKGKDMMMGSCGFSMPGALCTKGQCAVDTPKDKYNRM